MMTLTAHKALLRKKNPNKTAKYSNFQTHSDPLKGQVDTDPCTKLLRMTAALPLLVYSQLLPISHLVLPAFPSLSWLCVVQGFLEGFLFGFFPLVFFQLFY